MIDRAQAKYKAEHGLKYKDKVVIIEGFFENEIGIVVDKTIGYYTVALKGLDGYEYRDFPAESLGILYGPEDDLKFVLFSEEEK